LLPCVPQKRFIWAFEIIRDDLPRVRQRIQDKSRHAMLTESNVI
jgi:hypothetical protein